VTFNSPTREIAAWVLVVFLVLLAAWPGSRD